MKRFFTIEDVSAKRGGLPIDPPQVKIVRHQMAPSFGFFSSGLFSWRHLRQGRDGGYPEGSSRRVRRIMTQTVVGEMGFFRRLSRSATVSSDGPAILFTLTRANFERMRRERPDLANAFDEFIMRVLADRLDFANRELAAIEPLFASHPSPV